MSFLIAPLTLYAAFVAHVAVVASVGVDGVPNLTLLGGLLVMRRPGGVLWPAMAGLLCDCLFARPLGTTMLTATLTVTIARHIVGNQRPSPLGVVAGAFTAVAIIELTSRLLAGAWVADFHWLSTSVASLSVAAGSAVTVAVAVLAVACLPHFVAGLSRRRGDGLNRLRMF